MYFIRWGVQLSLVFVFAGFDASDASDEQELPERHIMQKPRPHMITQGASAMMIGATPIAASQLQFIAKPAVMITAARISNPRRPPNHICVGGLDVASDCGVRSVDIYFPIQA